MKLLPDLVLLSDARNTRLAYSLWYDPYWGHVRAGCQLFASIDDGIKHWKKVAKIYATAYSRSNYAVAPVRWDRAVLFVAILQALKISLKE